MSANDGAMTQRIPKSSSAHGAGSRLDPQPKFSPATRIGALRKGPRFKTKSEHSSPFSLWRRSEKSALPSPARLNVFRNCLGMIASLSTLGIPIGAATPFSFSNFSITVLLSHLLGRHRSSQADQNQRRSRRHPRKFAVHDLDRVGIEAFVGHVDQVAIIQQNRPEKGIGRVSRSEQVHRSEGMLPFFDGRPLH